jgi:hypothetical protein
MLDRQVARMLDRQVARMHAPARSPIPFTLVLALALAAAGSVEARQLLLRVESAPPVAAEQALVGRLVDAIGPNAAVQSEALVALIERQVSRDPGPTTAPAGLALRLAEGQERFIEGEYTAAAVVLADLRDELLERPALLCEVPPLHDALYRATLLLALAQQRAGNRAEADALWTALARGFPDRAPSRAELGPEPVEFFRAALEQVRSGQRGSLTITGARGDRCTLFLDERAFGTTPVRGATLPVGRYRLYARAGRQRGRLIVFELGPTAKHLVVDCARDAALRTDRGVVALRYAAADRASSLQAPAHARSLAAAVAADEVLLVGMQGPVAHATLTGNVLRVRDGALLRRASVRAAPAAPDPAALYALAGFLLGGAPSPALVGAWSASSAQPGTVTRAYGPWPWVALAGGLVGLGAGIPLLILDGRGTCSGAPRCPERYATATPGLILTVAGGVAWAGAATLFALRRTPPQGKNHAVATTATATATAEASRFGPWIAPWLGPRAAGLTAGSAF